MFASILVPVLPILSIAFAQGFSTETDNYPYVVSPGSPGATLQIAGGWCTAQRNSCIQICDDASGNGPSTNNCYPDTLIYECTCVTGPTPNITQYTQTLPYFECLAYRDQCVANTDDAEVQQSCHAIPCGSKNATTSTSSTSMSMSATPTASMSAASSTPTADSNQGALVAFTPNKAYCTGALVAGVIAFFGFAL